MLYDYILFFTAQVRGRGANRDAKQRKTLRPLRG